MPNPGWDYILPVPGSLQSGNSHLSFLLIPCGKFHAPALKQKCDYKFFLIPWGTNNFERIICQAFCCIFTTDCLSFYIFQKISNEHNEQKFTLLLL